MAKEMSLAKQFLLALAGLSIGIAFLAACAFGGYYYGDRVGHREVLAELGESQDASLLLSQGCDAQASNVKALGDQTAAGDQIPVGDQTPVARVPVGSGLRGRALSDARKAPAQRAFVRALDDQADAFIHSLVTETMKAVPQRNVSSKRTLPYHNIDGRRVGQLGLVRQTLPSNNSECWPYTLQFLGDQCFFKGDYAGAKSYYLRSISVYDAWNRRYCAGEKEPTIEPVKTADGAVQRFKNIVSLSKSIFGKNSGSTLVIHSAITLHFLALVEELTGSYADGDTLFRAAYLEHLWAQDSCPPFPTSFGADADVEYAQNGYSQIASLVITKFGLDSPYAATVLEQLAMFYDRQPQWAYSKGVEPGVKYTRERVKEEMARHPYTEERNRQVQMLLRKAIAIRENVKTAYDPQVVRKDMLKLWLLSKTGTFANFCSIYGYTAPDKE